MYGQPPHLRPPGGGRDQPPPHRPPPQPPSLPNSYLQYPNLYFQNPALQLLQNFALPNQLPNFQIQRNDFPVENPNFPPQQLSNIMLPPQPLPSLLQPLPSPLIQQPPPSQLQPPPPQPQPQQQLQASNRKELLERIDVAVAKAHRDLLAARENVSAWKVSQAALLTLRVDSWGSLGFQMQEVPSLNRLIVTEGKINAFIHCFVGVRWITSLHDLEVAICKNEGVERFEELELGPLLRHPLVLHYFSVKLDATEVSKMTTGDVISYLCEFLDTSFKKDVQVEEFVDFIVKKQSVSSKENLALRIQNLGKHISYLREARKLEDATVNRCLKSLKKRSENKRKKRPLFSLQKKRLDERFSALSQRVKSFSSAHEDFGAKHTIFLSSCSEDEDSDYCKKDAKEHEGKVNNYSKLSSQTKNDRVSSCPYPSAIEEMTRLGLKVEMDTDVSPSQCFNYAGDAPPRKRRKTKNATCSISSPEKEIRRAEINMDALSGGNDHEEKDDDRFNEDEFSLAYSSMRTFISTWKETCREQNVAQVLKGMLQSYNTRRRHRKRILSMFSTYPCLGLLNIAVTSIKYGMWDNIYDTLQAIDHDGVDIVVADEDAQYEIIDVQPSEKNLAVSAKATHSVSIEDVIGKLAAFVELDNGLQVNGKSLSEMQYYIYKKLHDCELWLAEQFSVKEFKCLGHGDFLTFLVKYCSVLPGEVNKFLTDEVCENTPFGVCIQQDQLVWLISQAADNLWGIETITDQRISMLLQKQFPVLNFRIVSNGSLEGFLEIVRENRNSVTSKCVLYSMSMLGLSYNGDSFTDDGVDLFEAKVEGSGLSHKTGRSLQAAYNDAVELLLKAPMLSDLSSWSHWEHKFAHLLGRLVEFLLNEVNTKELLCLVTKDGKVLRIDHSATVDSFLEAAVRGSSFLTAVKLLSFFSLVGGEKHVPLSLLKSQACRAFEVIIMNSLDSVDAGVCQNSVVLGKGFQDKLLGHDLTEKAGAYNKAVALASRFFLDCLDYVPPEFHAFFTDVLLTGLRSVIKDATSVILKECKTLQQRMFLHEVGFSLGIVEWINDYDIFISNAAKGSAASSIPCISAAAPELIPGLRCMDGVLKEISPSKAEISVPGASGTSLCTGVECATVNADEIANGDAHLSVELNEFTDAALLIESIRRDEFGLDPAISVAETSMLKKQHARLGRALHCLSQELYSQDSHFLLELVQNADDNLYLENVEPTLTFILQDWGIVVLNNEQGFSAENIRALCDIGNSTKKGYRAGYIGHKGIGFKSVFRVTDAPEIHSNGFHVKFDVTEGQIGFVLPTLIPARNVNVFSRLVSGDADQENNSCWNTCIVLPFKWTLSEENTMSRILTMFSDLDPSLLLFLHRLQCIRFRNLLNGTLVIMRKEILGNNIVKVSHGKDEVTWLVVSRKLRSDFIRHDVQNTEIAMAFTLQEADSGSYIPYLAQQPVFAFLPLRTYGLKFILQGDFVLPSSREEVDGNSPWNQWLLSEFPELFLTAKDSFCALPCFRENQGKAVSAYLTFVPLLGEVHGFFSSLPRMIISRLRMTNCLLLEGDCTEWVPPCKVLRGWDDQAQTLLTNGLLQEHLGLGFLNKEIVLSDQLAGALGIEEYGPKILIQLLSSLSNRENALGSLGLGWLSHLLSVLSMSFQSASHNPEASRVEKVLVKNLQKIAFIPLSDGTFSSLDDGTIWLHIDSLRTGSDGENGLKAFPHIFTKLRIVSPALFSAMEADLSCLDADLVSNLTKILQKIGVQWLTAHEITKVHILPNLSVDRNCMDRDLMIEYVCFAMIHLQSGCHTCQVEREQIISELQNKAFILTNYGFRRTVEVPIHFSEEYGNPAIMHELTKGTEMRWHVVDSAYLKHPVTKSLSSGPMKWREFFQEIGITDFLQVVLIQKGVTDLCSETSKKILLGVDFVGPELVARDWESHELVQILSLLCESGSKESCEYLLEVLDKFWDNHFSDKVKGYCYSTSSGEAKPFRSSFMDSICDTQWVVSSMDGNLHYPRDLFYDCEAVRLILGASAPYAVPKVRSSKLLAEIGFKTKVTVDDALEILQVWKRSGVFFKASVAQMARLYTFIWNELASCQIRSTEEIRARLFIFIPSVSGFQHEDLVCGIFCSPEEVYWHDSTGSVECLNEVYSQCGLMNATNSLPWQTLAKTYSGLYDFFVKECGVLEGPPFHVYLEMLVELSSTVSPSRAANVIFQILLKWSDGLDSGSLCTEDISYFKERLAEQDYTVLPTEKEKWVSLHPSFGTVCWCDDESLRKEFKCVSGIHFVCFGQPDWKILPTKVSTFLQTLGIPALSEVVSREAIYCGPANSSLKASLIDWALPYAQRYIYNVHPQRYLQLKQSGFNFLKNLEVVVVEKLFYRNVVKSCGNSSKKYECNCILQGNILYVAEQSDSHALFLELSRLWFDGTTELHTANFLHIITIMVESGSTAEQIEIFILNSQKVTKIPDEETIWSLASLAYSTEHSKLPQKGSTSAEAKEQSALKSRRKSGSISNWPPVDWRTAPDTSCASENDPWIQALAARSHVSLSNSMEGGSDITVAMIDTVVPDEFNADWKVVAGNSASSAAVLPSIEYHEDQFGQVNVDVDSAMSMELTSASDRPGKNSLIFNRREKLNTGTSDGAQALLTGRLGEIFAFRYFTEKVSNTVVRWVNENGETGLPYDIVVGENEVDREYIEVKATLSGRKDWFHISTREMQFALEQGESFSIAHVLVGHNNARISVFKNPIKLCQQGKLQLVVMMPGLEERTGAL